MSRAPFLIAIGLLVLGCSRDPGIADSKDLSTKETTANIPLAGGKPEEGELLSPTELAAKADVPLYPGAELPDGKSNVRSDQGSSRYEILMSSPDPVDKILKFYGQKLQKAERMPGGDNLMGMTPKGHYASVKVVRGEDKTDITVVVNDEK